MLETTYQCSLIPCVWTYTLFLLWIYILSYIKKIKEINPIEFEVFKHNQCNVSKIVSHQGGFFCEFEFNYLCANFWFLENMMIDVIWKYIYSIN